MSTTKEAFAKRFRDARKELGLSQAEVAERIGVSRAVVSDWEQAKSSPVLDRLGDVSQALKKPISYFFSASDIPDQYGVGDEEFVKVLVRAASDLKALQGWLTRATVAVGSATHAITLLAMSEAALRPEMERKLVPLRLSHQHAEDIPLTAKGDDGRERAAMLRAKAVRTLTLLERFVPSRDEESTEDHLFDFLANRLFTEFLSPEAWDDAFGLEEESE